MKKTGWFSAGSLWLGVALVGAAGAACSDAGDDQDTQINGAAGDLKHGGKGDKGDKVPTPVDAALPGDRGPLVAQACTQAACSAEQTCAVVAWVTCVRAPCLPLVACEPAIPEPVDAGPHAPSCAAVLCRAGTTCVEGPAGATCVEPGTATSCAAVLCRAGTTCVEGPAGATCVEPGTATSCAAVLCRAGTTCVEGPAGATCVEPTKAGCADFECQQGTHCELQQVQCIKAPCPPIASCVPDVDKCAAVRCKGGTHCELKQVQCFVAPCEPIAECVAN